jgi:hypothetical protein
VSDRRPDRRLRDEEPFLTMRSEPRRFGVGVPVVFMGAIGVGMLLARWNLALGLAAMLVTQTGGFLWLYVPALRRRLHEEAGARSGPGALEGDPTSE